MSTCLARWGAFLFLGGDFFQCFQQEGRLALCLADVTGHAMEAAIPSDGIIEVTNGAGEMFGFERTVETVRRGCAEDLAAEALLERIMGEVQRFRGETPQGDDQTVVVLKVEGQQSV